MTWLERQYFSGAPVMAEYAPFYPQSVAGAALCPECQYPNLFHCTSALSYLWDKHRFGPWKKVGFIFENIIYLQMLHQSFKMMTIDIL